MGWWICYPTSRRVRDRGVEFRLVARAQDRQLCLVSSKPNRHLGTGPKHNSISRSYFLTIATKVLSLMRSCPPRHTASSLVEWTAAGQLEKSVIRNDSVIPHAYKANYEQYVSSRISTPRVFRPEDRKVQNSVEQVLLVDVSIKSRRYPCAEEDILCRVWSIQVSAIYRSASC